MDRLERLENLSAYIDGELDEAEQRLLSAWCEGHPEDVHDFEQVIEVVRAVRALDEVDPPAGLRERILRAVAEAQPVSATRDQALEWLDRYLEDDLPAPQQTVVEHYLAVDEEFARTAEVHMAMLAALSDVPDEEPPSDLRRRIEQSVGAISGRSLLPNYGMAPLPLPTRRRWVAGLAAAAAVLVTFLIFAHAQRNDVAPTPVAVGTDRPSVPSGEELQIEPNLAPEADSVAIESGPTGASEAPAAVELPADDASQPVVEEPTAPDLPEGTAPPRPAPVPTAPDRERLADRADREPAAPAPRGVEPARRHNAPPLAPDEKVEPTAPVPVPMDGRGHLARPDFVDGSGDGSVLGDNKEGAGNLSSTDVRGGGGAGNPTRRTEAPPY